jgi:hypothetical protein
MARDHGSEQRNVTDVTMHEGQTCVIFYAAEIGEVACVAELIEDGDPDWLASWIPARQQRADVMRPNESGSAGYQDLHELICTLL